VSIESGEKGGWRKAMSALCGCSSPTSTSVCRRRRRGGWGLLGRMGRRTCRRRRRGEKGKKGEEEEFGSKTMAQMT